MVGTDKSDFGTERHERRLREAARWRRVAQLPRGAARARLAAGPPHGAWRCRYTGGATGRAARGATVWAGRPGGELEQMASGDRTSTDAGAAVVARVSGRVRFHRLWPLAAIAWLPLLAIPIAALLRAHPTSARLLSAAAATVGFGALYLWLVLREPFPGPALTAPDLRRRLALIAALTALGLALYPLFGAAMPPWYLVYATIAAGVALPARLAARAVALITILAAGATLATAGWGDALPPLVGLAAVGIGAITVGRLVVALGELREAREEVARLAVTAERLRFARDLHDLLGHTLSLIVLKSELARELTAVAPARVAPEIGDIEMAARAALREVRAVVADYRRPTLAGELAGAREILAAAGIAARIEHAAGTLPPALDTTLAWVVREGATNVIRHSRARHCAIRIARVAGEAIVVIADDGPGDADAAPQCGSGVAGLRERVVAHGGRLVAGAREPVGYRLCVALPLDGAGAGRGG